MRYGTHFPFTPLSRYSVPAQPNDLNNDDDVILLLTVNIFVDGASSEPGMVHVNTILIVRASRPPTAGSST